MPSIALELAEVHLDLLYERDEAGLLLRSRDPTVNAPLFHLVRTTAGNRWLLSAALGDSQRARLEEALAAEPVMGQLAEMEGRPPTLAGLREALAEQGTQLREHRGPAFVFGDRLRTAAGPTEILKEPGDVRTVPELAWIREASADEQPLSVARNSAGEVVAVCHSARSTATAAEAGVETAADYRGRGLAGIVVLGWAAAVIAGGRIPIYSTQWTNQASRAVARKLGLIPFGEDCHIGWLG